MSSLSNINGICTKQCLTFKVPSSSLGDIASYQQGDVEKEKVCKRWLFHLFGWDMDNFAALAYPFLV